MASPMTALPAVPPEMSIAWRIGTPEETIPENVRDQRARAIFWTTSPIFGIRKLDAIPLEPSTIRLLPTEESIPANNTAAQQEVPLVRNQVGHGDGDLRHGGQRRIDVWILLRQLIEDPDED